MTAAEYAALEALDLNRQGLYGSEFKASTNGRVGTVTVYAVLEWLIDQGFVAATEEPVEPGHEAPRTRYRITERGIRALADQKAVRGSGALHGQVPGTA